MERAAQTPGGVAKFRTFQARFKTARPCRVRPRLKSDVDAGRGRTADQGDAVCRDRRAACSRSGGGSSRLASGEDRMRPVLGVFLAIVLSLFGIHLSHGQDLRAVGFNGTWDGVMSVKQFNRNTYSVGEENGSLRLRLTINGSSVRLFWQLLGVDAALEEDKSHDWRFIPYKTNAIMYNMIGGDPRNRFVETQVYALMLKDANALYIYRTRAVNNYAVPAAQDDARWFQVGFTELSRVR
jgi:hypothetical protein